MKVIIAEAVKVTSISEYMSICWRFLLHKLPNKKEFCVKKYEILLWNNSKSHKMSVYTKHGYAKTHILIKILTLTSSTNKDSKIKNKDLTHLCNILVIGWVQQSYFSVSCFLSHCINIRLTCTSLLIAWNLASSWLKHCHL